MNRPETARFLSSLKDFQRDTVDYVFKRMYEAPSPARRFLIADEVGLGKTKVAAGIIARVVERMKAEDPSRRIDVIYICSNAGIARQNISRLNVTGSACHDLPDRITLLPRDVSRLKENEVNFIAFTPGTSLNLKSSGGKASERVLLFWLLPEDWVANKKGTVSLLTGGMRRDRFRTRVDELDPECLDQNLKRRFREALSSQPVDPADPRTLRERFVVLADQLGSRERLTDPEIRERVSIVGTLRGILAAVCIESLEPDLVILDEFQRFSDLLHGTDEASRLAQELFRYQGVRVLLLSATPYRMYATADDGGGDSHYADLVQTIGFLQGDAEGTKAFQQALGEYGKAIYRIPTASPRSGGEDMQVLRRARDEVTGILRQVMVRTERLAVTDDRSGMLKEVPCRQVQVSDGDIRSYLALQALARSLGVPDITEYWKSAPYLVNFMDDYDLKREFVEGLADVEPPKGVVEALCSDPGTLLSMDDVSAYRQLDPGNARLRNLVHDMLDSNAWRLLWIPSAWRYYEPAGEFAMSGAQEVTKRLIFSSWQVVPKVVAALLSYEAERRMLAIGASGEPGSNSLDARKRRRGLLRFSMAEGRPTGMPTLGLLYPSFVLAVDADPLALATELREPAGAPSLEQVLTRARERLAPLIDAIARLAPRDGAEDQRWYWAAPILLDMERDPAIARAWFGQANLAAKWRGLEEGAEEGGDDEDREADTAWAEHVEGARRIASDPSSLGRPPADLAEVLALNAVAGPAVTTLRALARVSGGLDRSTSLTLRNQAGHVAEGLRSLFNQPEVTAMLRAETAASGDEERHWQQVLEYCARGALQAVLDEYAHVLVEHLGVSGHTADRIATDVGDAIRKALTLRAATAKADFYQIDQASNDIRKEGEVRFRTRFAIRFGGRDQEDVKNVMREGDAQKAFNSPFWPFVLCSTSVGQEGLDFHLYCHAVMHWNLPSNPVDLEQREGRVHRYKGHAVRKNVARRHAGQWHYSASGPESDGWRQLFDAARTSRSADHSDLVPFWVYATEGGAQIERHVPAIPLSRDVDRAEVLRRSLAVYRMAFGQSRQDDLIEFLRRTLTPDEIKAAAVELRIDLTPDASPERHKSGMHQEPGDLGPEILDVAEDARGIALGHLEDLLDAFTAVRPAPRKVSAGALEQLLTDFAALRATRVKGVAGWDIGTPT